MTSFKTSVVLVARLRNPTVVNRRLVLRESVALGWRHTDRIGDPPGVTREAGAEGVDGNGAVARRALRVEAVLFVDRLTMWAGDCPLGDRVPAPGSPIRIGGTDSGPGLGGDGGWQQCRERDGLEQTVHGTTRRADN